MSPALIKLLLDYDFDIVATEEVYIKYIDDIINDINIALVNDEGFNQACENKMDEYEEKAYECVFSALERYDIPDTLLQLNRYELRNQIYEIQKNLIPDKKGKHSRPKSEGSHVSIKNRNYISKEDIAPYLYSANPGNLRKSLEAEKNKDLESVPYLLPDSIHSIGK